jgi:hypothetical protein
VSDDADPRHQAAAILADLAVNSPATPARLTGGSRETAEAHGFPWPPPSSRR